LCLISIARSLISPRMKMPREAHIGIKAVIGAGFRQQAQRSELFLRQAHKNVALSYPILFRWMGGNVIHSQRNQFIV
jgi:hypothetical protein